MLSAWQEVLSSSALIVEMWPTDVCYQCSCRIITSVMTCLLQPQGANLFFIISGGNSCKLQNLEQGIWHLPSSSAVGLARCSAEPHCNAKQERHTLEFLNLGSTPHRASRRPRSRQVRHSCKTASGSLPHVARWRLLAVLHLGREAPEHGSRHSGF